MFGSHRQEHKEEKRQEVPQLLLTEQGNTGSHLAKLVIAVAIQTT